MLHLHLSPVFRENRSSLSTQGIYGAGAERGFTLENDIPDPDTDFVVVTGGLSTSDTESGSEDSEAGK